MFTLAITNCLGKIMDSTAGRWSLGLLAGFVISLLIGHIVTRFFYIRLRRWIEIKAIDRKEKDSFDEIVKNDKLDIPPWLVGIIERLVFTVFVTFNIPATGIAMIAWVTVKMFYNWKFITENVNNSSTPRNNVTGRSLSQVALLSSLCSLFFALIGGLCMREIIF